MYVSTERKKRSGATGSMIPLFAQKCNTKPGRINLELAKKLDLSTLKKYPEEEFMLSGDIVINSDGNYYPITQIVVKEMKVKDVIV